MTELSIRTESTELPGGRLLRVSADELPMLVEMLEAVEGEQ